MELLEPGKVPLKRGPLHARPAFVVQLTAFFLLVVSLHVSAARIPHPPIDIHGRVLNKNGEPLLGVSVNVAGTTRGTMTDEKGNFQIQADKGDVLEFSTVGYQTIKITVGASATISITMVNNEGDLNEVVVTALGISRQKRALGYSQE